MTPPAAVTTLEQLERQWARTNPQGQAEQTPDGALALWNFDVGSAELKPEHEAALRALVYIRVIAERQASSFVVSGFASRTGAESANAALAVRRAETVARWLNALGFFDSTVAQDPGIQRVPGDDGRSLARNRRVEVRKYDRFPATPPPTIAPEFIQDRISATTQPAVTPPSPAPINPPRPQATSEELAVPDWIPARLATGFTFPEAEIGRVDNQWVKAQIRFEGALRVVGGDQRSRIQVELMAKEANRVETSLSYAITDWLAGVIVYEAPDVMGPVQDKRPNVRGGLTFTPSNVELGLAGEIEIHVKPLRWQDEFVYLSFGVTALVPVTLFGQQITVAVTGKLEITGVPGPATLRLAARIATAATRLGAATAAEAAAVAPAYAFMAAVVILTTTFIVANATGIEAVRQSGLRHAQRISGRDAFAARVAFEVVGQPAQGELESLMGEWRRFLDPEVSATAGRCYNDAGRQIEALRSAGQLDASRTQWTTRYGQEGEQPDLSFHGVRMRIFEALGGYSADGSTEFTLDQLVRPYDIAPPR